MSREIKRGAVVRIAPAHKRQSKKYCTEIITRICVDTGLACCSNRLHYDASEVRVYCSNCTPNGVDLDTLPESKQQLILQAALHA